MRSLAVLAIIALLVPGLAARAGADGLTVVAVGDVNMGTDFPSADFLPADGGAGLFASVEQFLAGDVVFGNLEGPLLDGGETKKCGKSGKGRNCYAFRTPSSYTRHLKDAGFTVMSLANNHALDFGAAGRASSIAQLDKVGIAHSGPKGDIASLRVRGKKVALVAFTSSSHSYNLLDIGASTDVIRKVTETHDLVIVSFHGGDEGARAAHVPDVPEFLGREPRGHLIQFSHAVIDAGADLVLGHGPHLLRGMEIYRGRLIAYSLGNFCTYGRFNLSGPLGRAMVLEVTLDPDSGKFRSGRMQSTIQRKPGGPEPDPDKGGIADVRRLGAADFPYTAPKIDADGRILPGASMGHGLFALNTNVDRAAVAVLLGKLKSRKIKIKDLVRWFGDERAGLDEKVIERFAHPAEKVYSYARYRRIFIRPVVLEAGKKFLENKKELLGEVERRYDVDRQAVAGIIATETRFGERRGEYRVFNALATQALKMKRRARWATKELAALFEVFDDDPLAVMGSYAGAVGLVQFMPTSILSYGQDWNGDGKIDLDNWPDALASCANYLKGKGWKRGQPIERGKANYKAIYRYNPSHHYSRVVAELAHAFGYRVDGAEKKDAVKKKDVKTAGAGASD